MSCRTESWTTKLRELEFMSKALPSKVAELPKKLLFLRDSRTYGPAMLMADPIMPVLFLKMLPLSTIG